MPAPLASLAELYPADLVPDVPGRYVVPASARAVMLAGIARHLDGPVLAMVPGEREAEDLVDDLHLFTHDALLLPAWETLPFEHISPNVTTMAQRARARHELGQGRSGAIIVGSVRALTQRLSPSPPTPIELNAGEEIPFDDLVMSLSAAGYTRTDRVETRGEFAIRGGLVDIYPAQGGSGPYRVEDGLPIRPKFKQRDGLAIRPTERFRYSVALLPTPPRHHRV